MLQMKPVTQSADDGARIADREQQLANVQSIRVAAGDGRQVARLDAHRGNIVLDVACNHLAGETAAVVLMALALSLAATLYPSWRAARLDPVEALRHE